MNWASAGHSLSAETAIPRGVVRVDGNSILFVNEDGKRYRLPIANPLYRERPERLDQQRTDREICTERDLFQAAGTFFELPARNAGGFAKIRPICSHDRFVHDYASWRGLMILSGQDLDASSGDRSSSDSVHPNWVVDPATGTRLCLGAVDDLWSLGKPVGRGGPWWHTEVAAETPSDPYLFAGYDHKTLRIEHDDTRELEVRIELDITGTETWVCLRNVTVPAGRIWTETLPRSLGAYWIRFTANRAACVTTELIYE